MTAEVSSRPFHDLTADEAELLKQLKKHPGYSIYIRRLHWAEAETLQRFLDDPENHREHGRFEGMKRAEKLLDWMVVEPLVSHRMKHGEKIPELPSEDVTADDLERVQALQLAELERNVNEEA